MTTYAYATPGCEAGNNGTWLMLDSAPQPDAFLRILPDFGGQSADGSRFPTGAPELAVEICVTSTEIDFGPKLDLYLEAGVREYLTFESLHRRLTWRVLTDGAYQGLSPDSTGIYRSPFFPGLWLDSTAFWSDRGPAILACLQDGLAVPEHAAFVKTLSGRRR